MLLFRAYKTEINPTEEQRRIIHQTIGVCRFIYNFYLAHNKEIYEKEKRFVSGMGFSKWLNNEFIPNNLEFSWIKEVGSKAVKQAIMSAETAFKKFFKGQSKFPRFKKKSKSNVKAYFPKNNKTDWTIDRHRIKIPTLGFIQLKEKGYIPINADVVSGTISKNAGRYYVSVLIREEFVKNNNNSSEPIGIDLGIKKFAIVSNGINKKNINKSKRVKKLERKLKREQRRLSKKYHNKKKRGVATDSAKNINKQILKIQKLHQTLKNIRQNYINTTVSELVKTKPKHITIEDLNVKGMMRNRHLSKTVAQQNFYYFRTKLENKCKINDIELRVVSRWYPSSKTCSCCGYIKKDLKLSDRVYICDDCGFEIDRDLNASINLKNAKEYTIAS
jgi:putative transposase